MSQKKYAIMLVKEASYLENKMELETFWSQLRYISPKSFTDAR